LVFPPVSAFFAAATLNRMSEDAPLGAIVNPEPALRPGRVTLQGSSVILEPLSSTRHEESLWQRTSGAERDYLWRYMGEGPFASREPFHRLLLQREESADPVFYAIVDQASNEAIGMAALMRIEPVHRVIEIGNIVFTEALQKTRAATEAMYLFARYAFEDLGYRRYEWKCNALNEASRRAALRLGFTFEGIFRQHMIVKGRNRDTAWFSMLDSEWPQRKAEFERWLDPANFETSGAQKTPLCNRQR
jgi:RimJ/RimL family protein N-acetyltransferase